MTSFIGIPFPEESLKTKPAFNPSKKKLPRLGYTPPIHHGLFNKPASP